MSLFNKVGVPELVGAHAKIVPLIPAGEGSETANLYVFTAGDLVTFVGAVQDRTSDYIFDRLKSGVFSEEEDGTKGSDQSS